MPKLLKTATLTVRELHRDDVAALVSLWTDPEVTRYMGGPRDAETVCAGLIRDAQWTDEGPLDVLPIVESATGCVTGHCGLIPKDVDGRKETELIYVLARSAWGHGCATEAAGAVMKRAFDVLELLRLLAPIDPANAASGRVVEKIGMRHEGDAVRPSGKVLWVYARDARRGDRALHCGER